MKKLSLLMFLFMQMSLFAQKECEYSTNVTDSLGTYKSTKDFVIYERSFAGNTHHVFFSLANSNGIPVLNIQTVQKNEDFIKANCFDENSKIFLQLNNGKVVTLVNTGKENCGTFMRIEGENKNTRINNAMFLFPKGSIEVLKSSPVTMMKIKYAVDTVDYPFRKEIISELDQKTYFPEKFFIDFLDCVK